MASSVKNNGIEGAKELAEQSGKNLKDGESLVGPTRRPDGTLRKPIKIRAGYVPQQEIAIHQSKGTLEIDRKDPSLDLSSLDSAIYEISNLNILATVAVDIYKKIRAIKKKIRLAEAKLQNISTENMKLEQLEKLKKLENWREELKLLEGANTTSPSTSSL